MGDLESDSDALAADYGRCVLEARAADVAAEEAALRREAGRRLRALKARRVALKKARQQLTAGKARGAAVKARLAGEQLGTRGAGQAAVCVSLTADCSARKKA